MTWLCGSASPFATLAWLAVCLGWAGTADAASFDCGKASSPRERLVCSDAALSELDGRLGKLYAERRLMLSSKGADLLQQSERGWLHYVSMVCLTSDGGASEKGAVLCLKRRYNERLIQLAKVGVRLGPFMFGRVDFFAAEIAPNKESGYAPGYYIQHAAYPRIDSPLSPQAEAWNRRVVKSLSKGDDCGRGDDDTEYNLGFANNTVISMEWIGSTYCHGMGHGHYSISTDNVVVMPSLRMLTPQDLFGSSPVWSNRLRKLFDAALRETGWTPPSDETDVWQGMVGTMMQPVSWMFTQKGLKVIFEEGEGGCYACNPPPITVSWADLKSLLPPKGMLP